MSRITCTYDFLNSPNAISNASARDIPTILSIEANVKIIIDHALYLETSLAIFEFYKSLYRWKRLVTPSCTPAFYYYSVEFDHDEEGAIVSMVPSADQGNIQSIWGDERMNTVFFPLDTLVTCLSDLERQLRFDLEAYFDIQLDAFIRHIPYSSPNR
ncbi:hypothetical protein EXW93_06990 [Exiguobacterium sp. JMULE1]|uniref:DUF7878 domain-containing protein n=1 Tax=Exiguobacterium indicum TaxID=296995 RepID=A0AAW3MDE4_9BACL|nr:MULTISPECIES: hypothetical protein [Exiguobacterium]KTR27093.1 hypothetical protein RSA11_07365 [Exiguobacterium indicum]NTY09338.1 hypothetical protein [Exiguobacterium sp. JMULE1]